MDIKLKNHFIQGKEVKQPGDVIKVDAEKGKKLCKKGYAVEVESKEDEKSNDQSQTSETTATADVDKADEKAKSKAKNKK